jgi:hypothetical protein
MAGVKLSGMEELKRSTRQIADVVLAEALDAAQDAAAQVVKQAIEAAAPVSKAAGNLKSLPKHPSGNLRAHIIIARAKAKGLTTTGPQNAVRRVLIGPSKKEAYYAYFLEEGWTWSKGRRKRQAYQNRLGGTTHSQSGKTEGTHKIEPHKWFPKPSSFENDAFEAGKAVFEAVLDQGLNKTK